MAFDRKTAAVVRASWAERSRLRRCTSWIAAAAVFSFAAPETASACVYLPTTFVGTMAEEAAWKKRAERDRRAAVGVRQQEFRKGVQAGTIDSAEGLAELLIPNVREWYADRSDCGPGGDGDGPPMPKATMIADAFTGSELDGLDEESLGEFVSATFVRTSLNAYNHDCNAEFRARFANRLRTSVSRRELDDAFLLLNESGERRVSYYSFSEVERVTPPRAKALTKRATVLGDPQYPVARALETFWTDAGPQLSSPRLTCPLAFRQLVTARDAELQRLRKRPSYSRLTERAANERERR